MTNVLMKAQMNGFLEGAAGVITQKIGPRGTKVQRLLYACFYVSFVCMRPLCLLLTETSVMKGDPVGGNLPEREKKGVWGC